ncbi:MAG: RagB/SusD family nutrient uptake outer membrane protein [Bacillati bacterium ANGP1]|uniref:RagB/SusD family nutrient uptake outer membrane protein n=1 Tax=Candidatus Segetimicrobium genomatis TaxID=2569760 RepID=A0A537IMW1_9BACT|nr:MAG: RagB/SusD family nutrient uptake outer membrane protein [Terrabacteria group bacterium ANGP1]
MRTRRVAIAAGLLVLAGCDFNILNTNQPRLDDLLSNPTRGKLTAAATGVMSSARTGMVPFIWRLGSMGREGINLSGNNQPDYAEPFFGPVQGGGSFGGTLWLDRYQSIRTANIYLQALANNTSLSGPDRLSDAERAASRGMANTYKALALLYVVETRAQLGAPVEVDRAIEQAPAPWVTEDSVYGYIIGLLNSAQADLTVAGSTAFPFRIPPGLADFATPTAFLKFNRALAAKANVLRATALNGCGGNPASCYTAALSDLGQTFLSTAPADFQSGAYLDFSTDPGDQTNDLSEPLDGSTWFALTSNIADADAQANGSKDQRVLTKIDTAEVVQRLGGIAIPGELKFTVYFSNGAADAGHPIPIIKDEELLLLRAEANWFSSIPNKGQAITDLNLVRQNSGLLLPTTVTPASSDAAFVTALLYERRYSLLWEQGARWIDARRFGLLATIPAAVTGGNVPEVMPVPAPECDARNLKPKTIGDIITCTPLNP